MRRTPVHRHRIPACCPPRHRICDCGVRPVGLSEEADPHAGAAAGGERGRQTPARIVAQKMSDNMGQPIVIENQPGAAGLIGAEAGRQAGARRPIPSAASTTAS